jgi:putative flippase GtrA
MTKIEDNRPQVGMLSDMLRFLAAGGINTLFTLALYQILLFSMSARSAYVSAWLCGIAFVIVFYPSKVFIGSGKGIVKGGLPLGAAYVGIFLLGVGTLELLIDLGVQARLAIVFVILSTSVLSFCVSRFLLRRVRKSRP